MASPRTMELEDFDKNGFVGPLEALNPLEMEPIKREIEQEFLRVKQLNIPIIRNRHLNWSVAARLCSNPAIVASATKLLEPDLILWRSALFAIPNGTGLAWHRDEYFTLLSDPVNQISVHLAISESSEDNCICLLPGSHKMTQAELREMGFQMLEGTEKDAYGAPNFFPSDSSSIRPVKMVLKPGQYFVFHPSLLHASFGRTKESFNTDIERNGFTRWGPHLSNFCLPYPGRLAMAMRVTVPSVKVFPAAFKETLPRIDKCVLLSGSNDNGVNELGNWAGELVNQA